MWPIYGPNFKNLFTCFIVKRTQRMVFKKNSWSENKTRQDAEALAISLLHALNSEKFSFKIVLPKYGHISGVRGGEESILFRSWEENEKEFRILLTIGKFCAKCYQLFFKKMIPSLRINFWDHFLFETSNQLTGRKLFWSVNCWNFKLLPILKASTFHVLSSLSSTKRREPLQLQGEPLRLFGGLCCKSLGSMVNLNDSREAPTTQRWSSTTPG
jgi:hypothetical protein